MSLSNMGSCTVYKTDKEYIIVTASKTEDWIWVADDPIYRVLVEDKDGRLVDAILKALQSSRTGIPNIPVGNFSIREKETLKKMGQSSYKNLYKKSNSCSVSKENGIVTISPYKPYIPGDFSSGLVVVKEGVVNVDMNVTSIPELESLLIDVLNRDYKG